MATRRWEPDFDFWDADLEGTRAAMFLDLAAKEHAPLASHPVRLMLRVAMKEPREDGLRSDEEAEALFAVEDVMVQRLTAAIDAIYVGRLTAEGYVTFVFYVPREHADAAEQPLAIIGGVAPYVPQWAVGDDPAWGYYQELLYPDPESHKAMMSRRAAHRITGVGQGGVT